MAEFVYTDYTDFKTENNILNGTLADEVSLNKSPNRLKKELNKVYNEQMLATGELCLPWRDVEAYLIGELVSYLDINYRAKTNNINTTPVVGANWEEARANIILLPEGDTASRPTLGVNDRAIRFNSETTTWESWNGISWVLLGGGQMLGQAQTKAISYNAQTIAENITVPAGLNAYSVGDITIEDGFTLTVESGSVYKIL